MGITAPRWCTSKRTWYGSIGPKQYYNICNTGLAPRFEAPWRADPSLLQLSPFAPSVEPTVPPHLHRLSTPAGRGLLGSPSPAKGCSRAELLCVGGPRGALMPTEAIYWGNQEGPQCLKHSDRLHGGACGVNSPLGSPCLSQEHHTRGGCSSDKARKTVSMHSPETPLSSPSPAKHECRHTCTNYF